MERHKVDSSLAKSIGYDYKEQTLEVKFSHGATWHYRDVPEDVWHAFLNASSIGRYFSRC